MRTAADELGHLVRVNAVRPGLVPTDAGPACRRRRRSGGGAASAARVGCGEDVAAAVRYLAGGVVL